MTVTYDGTELVNATYITRFVKHESVAPRTVIAGQLAREDGEVFIAEKRGRKTIQLQGVLKGSTQADLESKISPSSSAT
jgi:hypothetical protein